MTGFMRKIATPVDAQGELHLSEPAYKEFFNKVASDTFRGFMVVLSIAVMIILMVAAFFQLVYINQSLDKLDRNYATSINSTSEIKEVSTLAAFCAKLPESTTVARTQQCIERELAKEKK